MKLPTGDISTENSGVLLEQSFGVGNIGLIFEILRNKMYKNPISAIAREISCNARDAHREVGKQDTPIEISLPNAFSPEYRVRDFGPGISPERMSKVFIQYATSTKREDNIQTGGFGLGAKTPFSYTDTFSIVTITDKVQRTYNAYIDESRVGKMALVNEKKVEEPNGTTIVIPVARKDFREFIDQTVIATEYWDVKPNLLGITPAPKYSKLELLHQGKRWALAANKYDYYRPTADNSYANSIALIDGIAYGIDPNSISGLSTFFKALLINRFYFYFDNGELNLSASRDSIHYDEKTQACIKGRIGEMANEVIATIKDKVEKCNTYIEASDLYFKTLSEFQSRSELETAFKNVKMWKGLKLLEHPTASDIGRYAKLTDYTQAINDSIRVNRYANQISYLPTVKIFYTDKNNLPRKQISYYLKNNAGHTRVQIITISNDPENSEYQALVRKADADGTARPVPSYDMELLKAIAAESIDTVVVPKAVRVKRPKAPKKTTISAYYLAQATGWGFNIIKNIEVDNASKEIYVEADRAEKTFTSTNSKGKEVDYSRTALDLRQLKSFLNKDVYGMSKTRIPKLGKSWIPLATAIDNKLDELEKEISIKDLRAACEASHWLFKYKITNVGSLGTNIKDINQPDSLMVQYIDESDKVNKIITKYIDLIHVLGLKDPKTYLEPIYDKFRVCTVKNNSNLCELYYKTLERYPIIKWMQDNSYYAEDSDTKNKRRDIINYINLIDEQHSKHVKLVKKTG